MPQPTAPIQPYVAAAVLAASALLGGCNSMSSVRSGADSFLGVITPYKVEIVQGNVVTQEQIARVKPGMNRPQVRDILGSPLITDAFHGDRWDYVFTIRRQGAEPQERRISLLFDGDALKSIESPELPSERDFVASITRSRDIRGNVPTLELTPEQRAALPAPKAPEASTTAVPEPTGPTRSYPPLEAAR